MHRALATIDIINIIVRHLQTAKEFKSLACLARTCRVYWEPCIAMIWPELDSLEPLMSFMPTNDVHFLEESQWNRFWIHSQVVRKLTLDLTSSRTDLNHITRDTTETAVLFIYVSVASSKPVAMPCMLPTLQHLKLTIQSNTLFFYYPGVLLSSSLRSLDLCVDAPELPSHFTSFLTLVPASCPSLEEITFSGFVFGIPDLHQCVAELMEKVSIDRLFLDRHACCLIDTMGRTPGCRLGAISLDMGYLPGDAFIYPSRFDRLMDLSVDASADLFIRLFDTWTIPELRELDLTLLDTLSGTAVRQLARIITEKLSYTLKLLVFDITNAEVVKENLVFTSDLAAFYECRNLAHVELWSSPPESLRWRDADISRIAHSWPQLQLLELRTAMLPDEDEADEPNTASALVTLQGLMPLAEHCKSLRCLALGVDLTAFESPRQLCSPAPTLTRVEFDINSVDTDPSDARSDAVRQYIAALWPSAGIYFAEFVPREVQV